MTIRQKRARVVRAAALPQKSDAMLNSALPLDMRRWLCPAVTVALTMGSAPGPAFGPAQSGPSPNRRHSRESSIAYCGGAKPPPHIERQSREDDSKVLLRQSFEPQSCSKCLSYSLALPWNRLSHFSVCGPFSLQIANEEPSYIVTPAYSPLALMM
jgi:hypothetical protein